METSLATSSTLRGRLATRMREGLLELHDVVRMQLPVPMQADRAVLHMAQVTVEAQVQACTCTASTRLRKC